VPKIHLGNLKITSSAFKHGQRIPDAYANPDQPASPPLEWSDVPGGAVELAIVVHDPDAPLTNGFTHWVVYGIPVSDPGLAEGATEGFTKGVNGMGGDAYTPPQPPAGHGDHFYFFHLYALDSELGLPEGLDQSELLERIDDHIVEQARIVGTYSN
jgi:Raf kinase inhibitor-like YbhB/YbcL family protein